MASSTGSGPQSAGPPTAVVAATFHAGYAVGVALVLRSWATIVSRDRANPAWRRHTAAVVAGICGLAISAGLLGVVLLLTDLTTAANVAQLVAVVLAGTSSAAALIAWGRSRPTLQPTPGTTPPQPPAPIKKPRPPGEVAGAIASLVALVALVAAAFFGPGLLSPDAPNDAPGLVTAHIGDCVGSKAGADGYWVSRAGSRLPPTA